jgi:uncharacterized Zn finger protein (UPF0148 family)
VSAEQCATCAAPLVWSSGALVCPIRTCAAWAAPQNDERPAATGRHVTQDPRAQEVSEG